MIKPLLVGLILLCFAASASALTFQLTPGQKIVGQIQTVRVKAGQDITDIGQQYDVGYYELLEANQGKDIDHLYPGEQLVIPTQYILPDSGQQGIVINLAEMRLYYYPKDKSQVMTYPVGIGRQGWATPLGKSTVVQKRAHPTWHVPASIRHDLALQGIDAPKTMPPGPNNPLGPYMMRLSLGSYLIHGSNDPSSVGWRSSSGCIHLYNRDIKQLFQQVQIGTVVHIVNQPYKLAWSNHSLYLVSHAPIDRGVGQPVTNLQPLIDKIMKMTEHYPANQLTVNLNDVVTVAKKESGIPTIIARLNAPVTKNSSASQI